MNGKNTNRKKVSWLYLLGVNGWTWDSKKSIGEEYSFYEAVLYGNQYHVRCLARVSDNSRGVNACGDYGVVWIECDISTYTSREYISFSDTMEVISAIEHAENNLLRCGVPFVNGYLFHGKGAVNKARRNAAIRKRAGLMEATILGR